MKAQKIIYLFVLSFIFSNVYSQQGKIKKANKQYHNFAYVKTSEVLLKVAEDGYKSTELFQKLGDAFYFNNKMEDAVKWYHELMAMNENIESEYYFRYAQALKGIENYEESDKWMDKFYKVKPSDLRAKAFVSKENYLSNIDKVSNEDIKIYNLDINSKVSDFGTVQYKNQLIFASARGGGKLYKWNEQPFLDIYTATKQTDGSYINVSKLDDEINTKYHESTPSFTPDDAVMFFTRNNYFKSRFKKDEEGTNRLKMFRAQLNNQGHWDNITSVHFNSNEYSVAHPSINTKGTKLYFASDMPGTVGMSDVYVVDINKDGTLSTPKNLGFGINTEASESFPFINENGDLYFSSEGYPGLGGLDIYVIRDFETKMATHSNNFVVENIGKPYNSSQDDFGYYENLGTKEGFFTSNREGGKGDDDIYSFTITDCKQSIEGIVKNKETQELLVGAKVTLFNKNGEEIDYKNVGKDAKYNFNLDCTKEYLIRAEKVAYSTDEKRFTTSNRTENLQLDLLLSIDEQEVRPCDDLAKVLDIQIIYFDFDKYNIRYDAEIELQKVLAVLNKYPTMNIDIRSHTDCRGSALYNEKLSYNRAKSTRQYLIDKGIAEERLTAKGYGESRLLNECGCEPTNESNCSELEHQLNRRSEFIITSINGERCVNGN